MAKEKHKREMNGYVTLKEYTDLRITDTELAAGQRFDAQQLALKDALTSQEKGAAAALEGTKEVINKSDIAADKRFSLLSEKIDGVVETINKNTGSQVIYVTHSDLSNAMEKLQASIQSTLQPVVNFMNNQKGSETGRKDSETGRKDFWGYVVGGLGILFVILNWLSTHPIVAEVTR